MALCVWHYFDIKTSMHSSRMRTARADTVSRSIRGEGGMSAGGGRHPRPCEQNDWQTSVKTLPCPKPRLRVVIKWFLNNNFNSVICAVKSDEVHDTFGDTMKQ